MEENLSGMEVLQILGVIGLLAFAVGVAVSLTTLCYSQATYGYKTFEGELTSSEVITENGKIQYFLLSFNNETPIKVHPRGYTTLDFTVHSKMVIQLSRPTFWIYASDVYSVNSITKLPTEGD